ncbi:MAG: DNA-directed RNA polymerase subunit beta' [Oscillospiraceae bacterium]|jgi:DNA-directed RNA polymerase subunit beta'|nr:DNA-directed RNA polymerase subunit beta' [Oscillospiraceae bacterium]
MSFATFEAIQIGLASPEMVRAWSHGEVKKPETINYRTLKPERDGLFCERIFGPTKDWECHCGKYKKIRFKGKICDRCGVEVTKQSVRRERMGHIELAAPVSHIWYFKGIPSRMGLLLDLTPRTLEKVLYFSAYIVTDPGDASLTRLHKHQILSDKDYHDAREKFEDDFSAGMGAEAVRELLANVDCEHFVETVRAADGLIDVAPGEVALHTLCDKCPNTDDCREKVSAAVRERARLRANEESAKFSFPRDERLTRFSFQLRTELRDASGQKKAKLIKRLEVVEAFRLSGNDPAWMVIDVLPVIPPEIRPMVQLDGGRFATSDLNDLYRRVINRNNRLRRLIDMRAPDIITRNEKRMLQEAVDALIDNGRRGKAVTGANSRALKSLSDMLKGKQGRFRQNLLGKRVDYSGRSVIVVGPDLKIYQCGVPKEMAVELFRPFIMKKLVEDNVSTNIKSAKKMVDRGVPEVWDALECTIKEHPVLLNRAPTLHRLGIQAFEPILVEGRALKLHPLVCTAYNADFDGDQMAIHVPLSSEAQAEARILMLSANNLLHPKDGQPVTVPTQDMVLGSYYLTYVRPDENAPNPGATGDQDKYAVRAFSSKDEALMAYSSGDLKIHAPIRVRVVKDTPAGEVTRLVRTTVGRILFNEPIPQDLGYKNRANPDEEFDFEIDFRCGKDELGDIIKRCITKHGFARSAEVLDDIKSLGFRYSTRGALTISIADMTVPDEKSKLIHDTEEKVVAVENAFKEGLITDEERYKIVIEAWNETTAAVTSALQGTLDEYNPIYMMANSGARGTMTQIRQLAGMRGIMENTSGRSIEIPIKSNFREGLSVLEYFVAARGARKGGADTALRTADSGYLTRRLVDVSQDVIIREYDCGTHEGISGSALTENNVLVRAFAEAVNGRYPSENIVHPDTGEVLYTTDNMLTVEDAAKLEGYGIRDVRIRSVLVCEARSGVCAKCYGVNLATGEPVSIGEAVGVIAAQSIGEPGTQLTMRTFHTGGVAGDDITKGLPRVEELFEARRPKKMAILAEISGRVTIEDTRKNAAVAVTVTSPGTDTEPGEVRVYQTPKSAGLRVTNGGSINRGEKITDGTLNPHDIMAILGKDATQEYLIAEVQKVYREQGVAINNKHIEVIVRQMMRKVRVEDGGDTGILSGTNADILAVRRMNREIGERIAAGEKGDDGEELRQAESGQTLLGITKAALATDSFLSAASFQETTKVLTDAAIKGKIDRLLGLKENVIIGKLIPAGSGLAMYRDAETLYGNVTADADEEFEVDLSGIKKFANVL